MDSVRYSDTGNSKLIIRFGAGRALNFADTVASYDIFIVDELDKVKITGKADGLDVSGDFRRLKGIVVGVENATKLINNGQRIRVHGTEGYVEIL